MEVICSSGPTLEELQIIHASLSQSMATPAFVTDGGVPNSGGAVDHQKPPLKFAPFPNPQASSTEAQKDTKNTGLAIFNNPTVPTRLVAQIKSSLASLTVEQQRELAAEVLKMFAERSLIANRSLSSRRRGSSSASQNGDDQDNPSESEEEATPVAQPKRRMGRPRSSGSGSAAAISIDSIRRTLAENQSASDSAEFTTRRGKSATKAKPTKLQHDRKTLRDLLYSTESELIDVNLRYVLNADSFDLLTAEEKNRLVALLPPCDSHSAAAVPQVFSPSHHSFQAAVQSFRTMLSEGQFERAGFSNHLSLSDVSASANASANANASKSGGPEWKKRHYEEYWGQKWAPAQRASIQRSPYDGVNRFEFVETAESEARRKALSNASVSAGGESAADDQQSESDDGADDYRGQAAGSSAALGRPKRPRPDDDDFPSKRKSPPATQRTSSASAQLDLTGSTFVKRKVGRPKKSESEKQLGSNVSSPPMFGVADDLSGPVARGPYGQMVLKKKRGRPKKNPSYDQIININPSSPPAKTEGDVESQQTTLMKAATPPATTGNLSQSTASTAGEVGAAAPPAVAAAEIDNSKKARRGMADYGAMTATIRAGIQALLESARRPLHVTEMHSMGIERGFFAESLPIAAVSSVVYADVKKPDGNWRKVAKAVFGLREVQYAPEGAAQASAAGGAYVGDDDETEEPMDPTADGVAATPSADDLDNSALHRD